MVAYVLSHTSVLALQFILQLFLSYTHRDNPTLKSLTSIYINGYILFYFTKAPTKGHLICLRCFCNYKQCNKSFHIRARISPGKIHRDGISRSKDVGSLCFDGSSQMPLCKQYDSTQPHTIWVTTQERDSFTPSPTFSSLTT